MASGAPLPVREYATVAEMQAHAAALRAKAFAPAARNAQPRTPSRVIERKPDVTPTSLAYALNIPLPDRELTRAAYLKAMQGLEARRHKMRSVLRIVVAATGVSLEELVGQRRLKPICKARHIACYLGRSVGYTYQRVADHLKRLDHTTVLNSDRIVKGLISSGVVALSDNPVEMAQRLWDADWPRTDK